MSKQVKLLVNMTKNYGRFSQTFGIEAISEIETHGDIRKEYEKLLDVLNLEFEEFEANHIKDVNVPSGVGGGVGVGGEISARRDWYTAVRLVKNVENGKQRFAIVTTEVKYAKFGAPAYEEFLKEFGLLESIGNEYVLSFPAGTKVLVDSTGKHAKCVQIRLPDEG